MVRPTECVALVLPVAVLLAGVATVSKNESRKSWTATISVYLDPSARAFAPVIDSLEFVDVVDDPDAPVRVDQVFLGVLSVSFDSTAILPLREYPNSVARIAIVDTGLTFGYAPTRDGLCVPLARAYLMQQLRGLRRPPSNSNMGVDLRVAPVPWAYNAAETFDRFLAADVRSDRVFVDTTGSRSVHLWREYGVFVRVPGAAISDELYVSVLRHGYTSEPAVLAEPIRLQTCDDSTGAAVPLQPLAGSACVNGWQFLHAYRPSLDGTELLAAVFHQTDAQLRELVYPQCSEVSQHVFFRSDEGRGAATEDISAVRERRVTGIAEDAELAGWYLSLDFATERLATLEAVRDTLAEDTYRWNLLTLWGQRDEAEAGIRSRLRW
jgi:hypothetical protein